MRTPHPICAHMCSSTLHLDAKIQFFRFFANLPHLGPPSPAPWSISEKSIFEHRTMTMFALPRRIVAHASTREHKMVKIIRRVLFSNNSIHSGSMLNFEVYCSARGPTRRSFVCIVPVSRAVMTGRCQRVGAGGHQTNGS